MQLNGKITYSYTPETWSQEEFLRLGGFTVVFLNYNKAKFIEKSVASVLAQDFPLCEMFFMDDASTDGSGDTMERLVRAYRGRHKVTVVRNDENQHICGQWNIVSKLATGNWFGMFCGDDVAHPDRVSLAAKTIGVHPTLRGFCTSGNMIDFKDDPIGDVIAPDTKRCLVTGDFPLDRVRDHIHPTIGATAWWHRSLFDQELLDVPLDDILLRWILIAKTRGDHNPVWLFDGDLKTIEYRMGSGATNSNRVEHLEDLTPCRRWYVQMVSVRQMQLLLERTMKVVCRQLVNMRAEEDVMDSAREEWLFYAIRARGTWSRIGLLPRVVRFPALFGFWLKRFVAELFGLHVSSVLLGHRAESRVG